MKGELGQEYRRYLVGRSPAYLPWCIRSSQVVGRDGEVPHDVGVIDEDVGTGALTGRSSGMVPKPVVQLPWSGLPAAPSVGSRLLSPPGPL